MKTLNEKLREQYRPMIDKDAVEFPSRGRFIQRALDSKSFIMDLTIQEADMICLSCGFVMNYMSLFEIFE